ECRLAFNASTARGEQLQLNADLLGSLKSLSDRVRSEMPEAKALSVNDVLRWPGMFGDQSIDFAALTPVVLALAREAIDDFTATRAREGEKLAAMMVDRVNAMRQIVRQVAPRIPEAQQLFTEKLRQRLQEALGNASDDRILQEVAVFATRIDVAEEISRLSTHLDEVERVLMQGGASGKRLDFLMQELNREANTLGSKSAITEVSQAAMDLKLLIEQIREQVQNLE
ncbi:MAG: hypothetical protein ACD_10C00669G0002, partial [uncultured bacterium]